MIESKFLTKSKFSILIENAVIKKKMTYMDAVLDVCDKNAIDPKALVHMNEHAGLFASLGSIFLWGMVFYFMFKLWFVAIFKCSSHIMACQYRAGGNMQPQR